MSHIVLAGYRKGREAAGRNLNFNIQSDDGTASKIYSYSYFMYTNLRVYCKIKDSKILKLFAIPPCWPATPTIIVPNYLTIVTLMV